MVRRACTLKGNMKRISVKRKGEVAYALVKAMVRREGSEGMLGHLGRLPAIAESIGVPLEDLQSFTELIVNELTREWMTKDK